MKIALLGGSNSVKRFGLSSGLKENANIDFYNFALGGCSCLQNLDAIITHYETISKMDLIIIESNINDFYNVKTGVVPLESMKKNIAKYFSALNQLNVKVIHLILPINNNFISKETMDIFTKINNEHLSHIRHNSFSYIDINETVSTFLSQNTSLKLKMPINLLISDALHPKPLFMHQVGANIATFFFQKFSSNRRKIKFSFKKFLFPRNYLIEKTTFNFIKLKAEDFKPLSLIEQKNTFFKEKTILIDNKISFPSNYVGHKIIGISTWGEGGIKLSNNQKCIIKNFNTNYAFNEVVEEFIIDSQTYMINSDEIITEKCVNTKTKKSDKFSSVVGFLLEKKDSEIKIPPLKVKTKGENLNFLLPNLEIYLYDSHDFVKKLTEEDIDLLRDCACLVENIDLQKAYRLMSIAHFHRPTGVHIQTKLLQYKKLLNLYD